VKKKCIVVLGMHRSGTSALTGMLQMLGIELGNEILAPSDENIKGFFENIDILNLNEKILSENNSSWDDTNYNLIIDSEKKEKYVSEAKKIIEDNFSYNKIFVIKDPRLCITFPIWEQALAELNIMIKIILPYRNPFETAKSLKKRDGFSTEKSLLLWTKYFYLSELYTRKYKRIFIGFDELVQDTLAQIETIKKFVGIRKKNNDILKFIEKDLKHQNISFDNIKEYLPSFVRTTIELMNNNQLNETSFEVFDALREEFLTNREIFYAPDTIVDVSSYSNVVSSYEKSKTIIDVYNTAGNILMFEEEYYLENNQDVRDAGMDPLEHFVSAGIREGRFPNLFCKENHIFIKDYDLFVRIFENQWRLTCCARDTQELTSQKETEIAKLNEEINNIVEDLASIKEEKTTLNTSLQIQEEKNQKLQETLQAEQNQRETLQESYQAKETEIAKLNEEINNIVDDLVNIKESKCWIYTKPLRDLQKVIKE